MRRRLLLATGLLMLLGHILAFAQNQNQNLGLIAGLMQIKCESELKLVQSVHNPDSVVTLQKYITTYTLINSMIVQLEADMVASISLRPYKKIDKILKKSSIAQSKSNDALTQHYLETLKSVASMWETTTTDRGFTPLTYLSSVADITSTSVGIFKNISELKHEKVKDICQYLDCARLLPYSDILKTKPTKN